MAFTGSATITSLGKNIVRITGLSLAASASGTIGLTGKTSPAEVSVSAPFPTATDKAGLTLVDLIECRVTRGTGAPDAALSVSKAGTVLTDFEITLKNEDTAAAASGALEIYLQYHHSFVR